MYYLGSVLVCLSRWYYSQDKVMMFVTSLGFTGGLVTWGIGLQQGHLVVFRSTPSSLSQKEYPSSPYVKVVVLALTW